LLDSLLQEMENTMQLEALPDIVLEMVLSFVSYDEMTKFRRVSTKFNRLCSYMLNKGFRAVEKYNTKCLKEVKGKLPRRESERRDHPLARHCDVLTAIETRISLLSMTFMKYVELDLCCFIPGKVIDEIYAVLRSINSSKTVNRSCEVLQELRDISSMAMEHFDEKIVPILRVKQPTSPVRLGSSGYYSSIFTSGSGFSLSMRYSDSLSSPGTPLCRLPLQQPTSEPNARSRQKFARSAGPSSSDRKPSLKASKLVRDLKRQADSYKTAVENQNIKMLDLDRRIDQQNEIINQQNARLAEQEEKLAEMSRRLVENTSHFTDLNKNKGKVRPIPPAAAVACSSRASKTAEPSTSKPRKRARSSDTEDNATSPKRGKK